MFDYAIEFLNRIKNGDYIFLTFSGPTEIGKTLLLKDIERFIRSHKRFFKFDYKRNEDLFTRYGTLKEIVDKTLEERNKYYYNTKYCGVLFIEELFSPRISPSNQYHSLLIDVAFDIINSRSGKCNVLDTNKTIEELEEIDIRIVSRIHRNNSIFVDIPSNVKPYSSRIKK